MRKMNVGLVGCGNIGADLCIAVNKGDISARVAALTDVDRSRAESLLRSFKLDACICSLEENVAQVDFVVECAVGAVVPEVVDLAIRHGKDVLVVSVGGLLEHGELFEKARENGIQLLAPSGALCGLDGVRSAMEAGVHSAVLTTRKPPKGLSGADYLVQHGIDVEGLTEPLVVFEGTAREAVRAFPRNVNVAATLSLVGVGPDETRVRVIADPEATSNSHEVVVEGAFGKLCARTENLPSPRNPKSSYLASLSAVSELRAAAMAFVARRG